MSVTFFDWANKEINKCLVRYKDKKSKLKTCQKRLGHRGGHK